MSSNLLELINILKIAGEGLGTSLLKICIHPILLGSTTPSHLVQNGFP